MTATKGSKKRIFNKVQTKAFDCIRSLPLMSQQSKMNLSEPALHSQCCWSSSYIIPSITDCFTVKKKRLLKRLFLVNMALTVCRYIITGGVLIELNPPGARPLMNLSIWQSL